jgi:hypothetical protein
VAVLVAVMVAPVAAWPRRVAFVLWAITTGVATSRQLARA